MGHRFLCNIVCLPTIARIPSILEIDSLFRGALEDEHSNRGSTSQSVLQRIVFRGQSVSDVAHGHVWGDIGHLLLKLEYHPVYAQAIDRAIFRRFPDADREVVCRNFFPFSQLPESTHGP